MGRNTYFQFKQFKINQEKSAMKVGTDGVLLGAWVNVENVETILDVGTGTGLIALMLAQRSSAEITGIEIEPNAAKEAEENFRQSIWSNRISVQNCSFQDFAETSGDTFDLIVSNPPFFTDAVKSSSKSKSLARHTDQLPFYKLIQGASKLLNPKGRFAVVLPFSEAKDFIHTAECYQLHLIRKMEIQPAPLRKPNRVLLEFCVYESQLQLENLTILCDDRVSYSEEYKKLTCDFYLNF